MKIEKLKVIGAGTAGLMFATYAKKMFPNLDIKIYRNPKIKHLLAGESTQPYLTKFFDVVFGSDESKWTWLEECNSTYKFYIEHNNWNYPGHKWIFPVCPENNIEGISIKEYEDKLLSYSKNNLPPKQSYAYHLQSNRLQPFLLNVCKELNIDIIDKDIKNIEEEKEDDNYIIDCRGFHGQESSISVSPAIINDYAIAGHIPFDEERYFTKTIAHEVGWSWEIPLLRNQLFVGRVFSTKHLSIEDAKRQMNEWYGLETFNEVPFKSKYNPNPCTRTSLKIGSAAVFIEPLESTTLTLITFMVDSFCTMIKSSNFNVDKGFCDWYNKGYREMVQSQVSYIEGIYSISERRDSSYWKEVTSNYECYINKLEKDGWPEYFGTYGFNSFFKSFNKLDDVRNVKLRIHSEQ